MRNAERADLRHVDAMDALSAPCQSPGFQRPRAAGSLGSRISGSVRGVSAFGVERWFMLARRE